jgi:metallo-beta-lactamase family protein
LAEIVNHTTRRGGNIVIPVFALERAQELMYCLSQLVHHDRIPDIPIYLDSPMAVEVTNVFRRYEECFDTETQELLERDESPLEFPGLRFARTTEESKAINGVLSPSIIMSASGMCDAGRIKHHLRYNIGRHECTLLFVGYQGRGTLGRQILEGAREVRIHGKTHRVEARIEQLHGFSGHADRSGLLRWLGHLKTPPRRVFVTHGEEEASTRLAQQIKRQWGWQVSVPAYGTSAELS